MAHRQAFLSCHRRYISSSNPSAADLHARSPKFTDGKPRMTLETFAFILCPAPLTNASFIDAKSSKQRAEGNIHSPEVRSIKFHVPRIRGQESQLYDPTFDFLYDWANTIATTMWNRVCYTYERKASLQTLQLFLCDFGRRYLLTFTLATRFQLEDLVVSRATKKSISIPDGSNPCIFKPFWKSST